jgi:hypothetical protein
MWDISLPPITFLYDIHIYQHPLSHVPEKIGHLHVPCMKHYFRKNAPSRFLVYKNIFFYFLSPTLQHTLRHPCKTCILAWPFFFPSWTRHINALQSSFYFLLGHPLFPCVNGFQFRTAPPNLLLVYFASGGFHLWRWRQYATPKGW